MSRGLLPAENALNRVLPRWLSSASANTLRAELWVHKNNTLMGLATELATVLAWDMGYLEYDG